MRCIPVILIVLCLTASMLMMARASQAAERVLIFAAASTRDAVEAVIQAFPRDGLTRIAGVYAATSALARQIVDGAPAALFLSANKAWMAHVSAAGVVAEQRDMVRNRLVLVAARGDASVTALTDATTIAALLNGGRLAVAETTGVPAGIYARQALKSLGIWEGLRGRLAQAPNVRVALLLVERGEAPLGLVYSTDARASRAVRPVWTVPAAAHEPIVYPLALLKSATTNPAAAALFSFLLSPDGRRIFADHGFEVE